MCILFVYIPKTHTTLNTAAGPYLKLVIASNRDEFYNRPTNKAQFWESDPNILAGQDAEEGGTWLGINKSGKLSALLNIMSNPPNNKLKSRGALVTGFLKSNPNLRGRAYCNNLRQDDSSDIRKDFRLFNLITIDLLPSVGLENEMDTDRQNPVLSTNEPLNQSFEMTYLTNALDCVEPRVLTGGGSEIYAFGNSAYESPFCKVSNGCQKFDTIIKSFKDVPVSELMKTDLKQKLLSFLKSSEKHYPDSQMDNQAKAAKVPSKVLPELSSIFVKSSNMNYGTRTHTVIIIDSNNQVDFHEWTLSEPIDIGNPKWLESKYEFQLHQLYESNL